MANELHAILSHLCHHAVYPVALATLVRVQGSSYRRSGARLMVDSGEASIGSISGGCLEEDLLTRARGLLQGTMEPQTVVYDTTSENDLVWGVGLGCHGVAYVVLERLEGPPVWLEPARQALAARAPVVLAVGEQPGAQFGTALAEPGITATAAGVTKLSLHPPLRLVVAGAGEDARPLARLAHTLGWSVAIADPRPALVTRERFPDADELFAVTPAALAERLQPDAWTAAVIMTHHYRFDLPLLGALLPLGLPYLGLLGPRARAERLWRDLTPAPGAEDAARLHAPVGLDLGGDGPEAVALAIVAEIQAVFHQRDGRPLRHRQGSIHE